MQDGIDRAEYFQDKVQGRAKGKHKTLFPDACNFLLGELEAEECLPTALNILRLDKDILDFWYGDILTEFFYEPFYKIANNKIDDLKYFILEPGNDPYARSVISDVLAQIALHEPARRSEVIEWFREVIDKLLKSKKRYGYF